MAIPIGDIREELYRKVDTESAVNVEKIERYCNFVQLIRDLNKEIKKDGPIVRTENGAQVFFKAHPAIAEINKINAQLLNIEKSFDIAPPQQVEAMKVPSLT